MSEEQENQTSSTPADSPTDNNKQNTPGTPPQHHNSKKHLLHRSKLKDNKLTLG